MYSDAFWLQQPAPCLKYTMVGEKLTMTESDLGVVVNSTFQPAAHMANCVKKANQILGMIQIRITYKKEENAIAYV